MLSGFVLKSASTGLLTTCWRIASAACSIVSPATGTFPQKPRVTVPSSRTWKGPEMGWTGSRSVTCACVWPVSLSVTGTSLNHLDQKLVRRLDHVGRQRDLVEFARHRARRRDGDVRAAEIGAHLALVRVDATDPGEQDGSETQRARSATRPHGKPLPAISRHRWSYRRDPNACVQSFPRIWRVWLNFGDLGQVNASARLK